jgi:hypothetical protein
LAGSNLRWSAVVATIIAELKALLTIGNVHLQPVGARRKAARAT